MAAPAKTRIAHMVAPGREVRRRRGVHHGLVPFVDVEGSIFGPLVVLDWFREDHISDEGRFRSQPRLLNLVTNRAGNAICCGAIPLWKLSQRKTRQDRSVPSRVAVRQPDGRHMADRAFILDRLPYAKAYSDVLSPAYGNLHLGQNIPVGTRPRLEVTYGQKLDHGRKQPSQHVVRSHGLTYGHPPEHASRSNARIHR